MNFIKINLIIILTFLSLGVSGQGCTSNDLTCALAPFEIDQHADLHAVVVMQNGRTVFEHYYNGGNQNRRVDVRSAGKSITALLMGIALDQKAIKSLDDAVADYWLESAGTAVGSVRLKDLLTMRSGLDADANNTNSFGYEDYMDASDDPKAFALTVPNRVKSGTLYRYNSLAAYITGIVIGQAVGHEMGEFAQKHLFKPLNIDNLDWQKDRSGITKGQGNLFIDARGFTRLGQLVLDGGEFEGHQVVSTDWIKDMLSPQVDFSGSESNTAAYGYLWYQQFYSINNRSIELWYASGNGGNKIYLIPELGMVVTVMSDAYGQGRSHRRSEKILMTVLDQATSYQTIEWSSGMETAGFWQAYVDSKGGLTWGQSSTYPAYDQVKEGDTFMVELAQGVCLMEFFHSRWRRANDVRRWDDSINKYGACPYVFD